MFFSPYFEFENWGDQAIVAWARTTVGAPEGREIW